MPRLIRVSGGSMEPTVSDGDYILITKPRRIRPGFIYVLQHERLGRIVKRLDLINEGQCKWSGDSLESTESDRIGLTSKDCILGQARLAITPRGLKRLSTKT